jgi:5-methylcytosine-specific restriction protein A
MPAPRDDPQNAPWRSWYTLQRWRRRARHQLKIAPLCASCLRQGLVTPATVAHHLTPHRGNWNSFRLGRLESLCEPCHAHRPGDDRAGFAYGVGLDGLPLDPSHPWNAPRP